MTSLKPPTPMIWAHRGRNRLAPENTLSAFKAALDAGDPGIELDVALSADGRPIVIHDDTVDRTTDGSGAVAAMTYRELRSLDAGSWFHERFAGEKLPDLADVLTEIHGRAMVNIELKSSAWNGNPRTSVDTVTMELVARLGMGDAVLYSSFHRRCLERIRQMDARARIGVLADRGDGTHDLVSFAEKIGAYSIHPHIADVETVMNAGYDKWNGFVYPYTVDSQNAVDRLVRLGVDGWFADLPF